MPTFSTPEPISVTIEVVVGDIHLVAGDRSDTVVEVRPSDPNNSIDVRFADQTRIDYAAGTLVIQAPKQRPFGMWGKVGSVDIRVQMPSGSAVYGDVAVAAFHCVGRLGQCRFKTATGDVQADHTGKLEVHTSAGAVDVGRVDGNAEVTTGSGRVQLGEINGAAVVKNSNGGSWIGQISGDLRVNAANGGVTVDRAEADVLAHTAHGDVRVGDMARGTASLKTAVGEIEVGIRSGTAALLDVSTSLGRVHNDMTDTAGPATTEETLEVRARTSLGDIVIHRA